MRRGRLVHPIEPLAEPGAEVDPECGVLQPEPGTAHPEDGPAPAHVVDGDDRLGDHTGVSEGVGADQ